jgi:hypothetical protein
MSGRVAGLFKVIPGQPHTGIAGLQVVLVAVPEPSTLVLFGVAATFVAILIGGLRSR